MNWLFSKALFTEFLPWKSLLLHTQHTHKEITENIGHLKIVGHEWTVPFRKYKFRILLCLKDLRGNGDTSRSLLKVSQAKQMSKRK